MLRPKKKEDEFYTMFISFSEKVREAGELFSDIVHDFNDVENKVTNMKVMESECDMEAHKILRHLHESFITPFDREDIYSITREMDEIVDSLEEVANRFDLFDIQQMKPEALRMADMILQAIVELKELFVYLPELKKSNKVMTQIIEVNRIENEGDLVYRQAIKTLFKNEKDPIELIKWKHLFEQMEASLDSCETVANILEGVVMKYV